MCPSRHKLFTLISDINEKVTESIFEFITAFVILTLVDYTRLGIVRLNASSSLNSGLN